jgi:hypothetical protein
LFLGVVNIDFAMYPNTLNLRVLLVLWAACFFSTSSLFAQEAHQVEAQLQRSQLDSTLSPSNRLLLDTTETIRVLDSLYIAEVEQNHQKPKVLHAEPLFIDLIRDLGARKGEREWNVGLGMTDRTDFDAYEALVEYEWAPIDRLGLEIELPFSLYQPRAEGAQTPQNRLNSLKLAAQWSFFVNEKSKTTLALGYLHEFELTGFENYRKSRIYTGNTYSPFFVAAKRWGQNFHTLIYSGPVVEQDFETHQWHTSAQLNTNFHYLIPGSRNFIGLEVNKLFESDNFDMAIRPQMRLEITQHMLVGIVAGVPISREKERLSFFLRMIYEPPHKKSSH